MAYYIYLQSDGSLVPGQPRKGFKGWMAALTWSKDNGIRDAIEIKEN